MIIALASIASVLLATPILTVRVGRRVHPADWTRWSFGSLVAGAVAAEAALLLFAFPTVLRALGAHALVAACARMTGSLIPGGPVVGWSIAATSLLLPVGFGLGVAAVRRTNRGVAACVAGAAPVRIGGHDVVLVPFDDVVALTVGGDRRVIVVSDGMRRALSTEGLEAVVRHEASHGTHGHDRYLAVLAGLDRAFVLLAFVRRSTSIVRCGIERWADEDAAASHPDGRRIVRDALVSAVFATAPLGVAAFGAVATIAERASALQVPMQISTARRRAMIVGMSVLMLMAAGTAAAGGTQLWRVLIMPPFCTH